MRTNRRTAEESDSQARTRADILTEFRRLVKRHGYSKVTMEDIAAGLGRKKSFLYYYFRNKHDLLHAMVEADLRALRDRVREAVERAAGAPERVRNYFHARIDGVIKGVASYSSAHPIELCGESGHPKLATLIHLRQEFDRDEERYLASLLRQGMKEGAFRVLAPKTLAGLTYFMLSAVRGVELELILSQGKGAQQRSQMGAVLDIFLRGLGP